MKGVQQSDLTCNNEAEYCNIGHLQGYFFKWTQNLILKYLSL